jgi:hypothetical protein
MSNLWRRSVFLGAILILAAKMLLFGVDWKSLLAPVPVGFTMIAEIYSLGFGYS